MFYSVPGWYVGYLKPCPSQSKWGFTKFSSFSATFLIQYTCVPKYHWKNIINCPFFIKYLIYTLWLHIYWQSNYPPMTIGGLKIFLFLYASSCSCVWGVNVWMGIFMCMVICVCGIAWAQCVSLYLEVWSLPVSPLMTLLTEAGSLTLTEPRARAYQFNYSDEPACPSFRNHGLGITGNHQTCSVFPRVLGNLHSVAHAYLTSTLLTEISRSPFLCF